MPHFAGDVYSGGMLLTPGGLPVIDTNIGKYYFVNKRGGADGNPGTSMDKPFATIDQAREAVNAEIGWSNSPWGNNPVVVISPGVYAENLTSIPYGATVIGLGMAFSNDGTNGVVIKPASGKPLDVSSIVNTRFINIKFESADSSDCVEVTEMNSSAFENCVFEGTAGTATTAIGLDVERKGTNNLIRNNIFNNVIKGINLGYTTPGDQFAHSIIEGNHFLTNKTNAIYIHANQVCSGLHITRNYITMTDGSSIGIDDNSNTAHIMDNYIYSPNDAIEGGLETNGNYANGSVE
jgi:hypothetical protein